jgi:hypothetical protein
MPSATDTNEIFRYVLTNDRHKPKDQQPTFLFHYLTVREEQDFFIAFDNAAAESSISGSMKMRCDAVRSFLAGWENFKDRKGKPVPFDPNKLEEVVSDTDLTEFHQLLIGDMKRMELEKKRSALSLHIATAKESKNSVAPVTTGSATPNTGTTSN